MLSHDLIDPVLGRASPIQKINLLDKIACLIAGEVASYLVRLNRQI
jgi:hypothetical protein